jgi:hypothetical protein
MKKLPAAGAFWSLQIQSPTVRVRTAPGEFESNQKETKIHLTE